MAKMTVPQAEIRKMTVPHAEIDKYQSQLTAVPTGKYRLVCPKQDPGTNRFLCWIPRVFLTAATYFFANVKKHNS